MVLTPNEILEKLHTGLKNAEMTRFSRQEVYYLQIIYNQGGAAWDTWKAIANGSDGQFEAAYRRKVLTRLNDGKFIHIETQEDGWRHKHFHLLPALLTLLKSRYPDYWQNPYNQNLNTVYYERPYKPGLPMEQEQEVVLTKYLHEDILLKKGKRYEFMFQHTTQGVTFTINEINEPDYLK